MVPPLRRFYGRGQATEGDPAGGGAQVEASGRPRGPRGEMAGRSSRASLGGAGLLGQELSVDVEHTHPVAVVRPRGVLDAYNAPDLRAALLECVAEQPFGAVIDASGLTVDDDVALTVLATVARQCAEWPGTRLALAGAPADVVAAAERLGVPRYLLVSAGAEQAMAALDPGPQPPIQRERINPDRNAPGVARAAVVSFCDATGVRDHDAAQLVASELVTNAVVHVGTPIDLTLRLVAPQLHIAVRDGGPNMPRMAEIIDETSESGRGLLLVDALASRWGSFVPHVGKIVWATVRVASASWDRRHPA
jgi:anti-anti-sigma regulatory factor